MVAVQRSPGSQHDSHPSPEKGVQAQQQRRIRWTGKYEAAGYNQSAFQVDLVLRAGWDGVRKDFYTEIDRVTRFGFNLIGNRWYGVESGFPWLALAVFPKTALTPEMWGLRGY